MGQRLIFCVWGLRPKFNSSASTSTRCATGNVRQRQRQPQPQQSMPAVAAAGMLCCLMLACCTSGEWHVCQGGEQPRRWSGVGAYRACHSVGSARGRPRRAPIFASAMHVLYEILQLSSDGSDAPMPPPLMACAVKMLTCSDPPWDCLPCHRSDSIRRASTHRSL